MRWLIRDKDGNEVNRIVASEEFAASYCDKNGYKYEKLSEPEQPKEQETKPTQLDRIEAQVVYTAMMTDTLLEE